MKILIRNSDNAVIYAQDDMVLTAVNLSGNRWRDDNFNTSNATIAEASLPADWTGAVWAYSSGVWSIHDQVRYDAIIAEKAATAAANHAKAIASLIASITSATQQRLDSFAKTRNYDGILSACTYAASLMPQFAAEGQCCVTGRDNTWATLYTIMAEVQAGTRPMPASFADIEPLLPVLAWPV